MMIFFTECAFCVHMIIFHFCFVVFFPWESDSVGGFFGPLRALGFFVSPIDVAIAVGYPVLGSTDHFFQDIDIDTSAIADFFWLNVEVFEEV